MVFGHEAPFDEDVVEASVDYDEGGVGVLVDSKVHLAAFLDKFVNGDKREVSLKDSRWTLYIRQPSQQL